MFKFFGSLGGPKSRKSRASLKANDDARIATSKKPIAVVTMVYNEPDILPIWLSHYGAQIGHADCYVLDHGSYDGSTDGLPCNVIRLPRSPFDELLRSRLVSDFCSALLQSYSAVLYVDSDELVMADPRVAGSLRAYASLPDLPPIVTSIGLDVVHDEASEPPLDPTRPILAQRSWVWPSHALCKPTLLRQRHVWSMGFHLTHEPLATHHLFLFHIAYADLELTARRQAKRNVSAPVQAGGHHEWSPDTIVAHIRRAAPWGNRKEVDLHSSEEFISFRESLKPYEFGIWGEVWRIPDRFSGHP